MDQKEEIISQELFSIRCVRSPARGISYEIWGFDLDSPGKHDPSLKLVAKININGYMEFIGTKGREGAKRSHAFWNMLSSIAEYIKMDWCWS